MPSKTSLFVPFLIAGAVFMFPAQAQASKSVSSPYVKPGKVELEAKTEILFDEEDDDVNGAWEESISIGYGVTEFIYLEIGTAFEDEPHKEIETSKIGLEAKFQLTEKGTFFIDSGLKLEYSINTSTGLDKIQAKALFAKDTGRFAHTANLGIDKEVGMTAPEHEEYGLAWRTKYEYAEDFEIGVEYYGDLGDTTEEYRRQKHMLGPVLYGKVNDVGYQFGVLGAISHAAPDVTLKLNLEYGF